MCEKTEYDKVLEPLRDKDLPRHVVAMCEAQKKAEMERKEKKLEEMKFCTVKTIDCLQFIEFEGIGFCSFDAAHSHLYTTIKLPRASGTPRMIISYLSDMNGIPADQIRLWEISSVASSKYSLSSSPIPTAKLDQLLSTLPSDSHMSTVQ